MRRHWLGRPRGWNKTGDTSALTVVAMLHQLPDHARAFVAAGDKDQARLTRDALYAIVAETRSLRDVFTIQNYRVVVRRSGVSLEVLSSDAPTSLGLTPHWIALDELCQWPQTDSARSFFESLMTALPKVPTSRLVVTTTAGRPGSWQHALYRRANEDAAWRVSEVHSPPPWMSPADVETQRRELPASSFARWFENQWATPEDALGSAEDIAAAIAHTEALDPVPGVSYVIGVDLGFVNDRTAAVVCHGESESGERVVCVDRVEAWQGSRAQPVDIASVEAWLVAMSRLYNGARVRVESPEGVGLVQRLQRAGVVAEQVHPTQKDSNERTLTLYVLLRSGRLRLLDDPRLVEELATVVVRESATTPNVYRIDHRAGAHNDLTIALSLAAYPLAQATEAVIAMPGGGRAAHYSPDSDSVVSVRVRRWRTETPFAD